MPASFSQVFQTLVLEVLILNLKEISLLQVIDLLVLEADMLGHYLVFKRIPALIAKDALLVILLSHSAFVADAG